MSRTLLRKKKHCLSWYITFQLDEAFQNNFVVENVALFLCVSSINELNIFFKFWLFLKFWLKHVSSNDESIIHSILLFMALDGWAVKRPL